MSSSWTALFAILAFLVLFVSAFGDPPGSRTKLTVYLENSSVGSIDVSYQQQTIAKDISAPAVAGPTTVPAGPGTLLFTGPGVPGPMGSDEQSYPLNLSSNTLTDFIYYGFGPFGQAFASFTAETSPAADSEAQIRVANCGAPFVDAYLLPSGGTPAGNPTDPDLACQCCDNYQTMPHYQEFQPGTYDVYFTIGGEPAQILAERTITVGNNQNRTVVLLNNCPAPASTASGGLSCTTSYGTLLFDDLN